MRRHHRRLAWILLRLAVLAIFRPRRAAEELSWRNGWPRRVDLAGHVNAGKVAAWMHPWHPLHVYRGGAVGGAPRQLSAGAGRAGG